MSGGGGGGGGGGGRGRGRGSHDRSLLGGMRFLGSCSILVIGVVCLCLGHLHREICVAL